MDLPLPRDLQDESLQRTKILLIGAHDEAVRLFEHEMKGKEIKDKDETPEPEVEAAEVS